MHGDLVIKMYAVMLDCRDTQELAKFYTELLGWVIAFSNDEYTVIAPEGANQGSYPCISFQLNSDYQPPTWPEKEGAQQQMIHLDFAVNDLAKSVEYAVDCGATISQTQYSDDWKVMYDPAGHTFCLCQMKPIIDSNHFALL